MEKRLIPEVRFKGFKGNWEEKRLGDIANIVGGGTPSTKIESYWNGEINWFTPSEISDERYAYESKRKITEEGLKKSSAKILPKDKTILFTSRATIGLMAILKKDSSTNQGFQSIVLKDEEKTNIYFLFSQKHKFEKYGLQRAYGSTFLEISGREMRNMIISLPEIDEQEKIGRLFEKLDQTIDLQGKVIEENKRLKQALLQKLFPKKGQKLPDLRLKGFSGDWEEDQLGNLVKKLRSYPLSRSFEIKQDTNYKYIHYGDIHRGNAKDINNSSDLPFIKTDDFNKYELLEVGDFIVADASEDYVGIASPAYIREELDFNLIAGLHTIAMRPIKLEADFLYYFFNTDAFKSFGKKAGTGIKVYGISYYNLSKLNMLFPSLPEQEAIGNLFRSLDEKIEREEERLEGYKTLKKSLLQKMFV